MSVGAQERSEEKKKHKNRFNFGDLSVEKKTAVSKKKKGAHDPRAHGRAECIQAKTKGI